MIRPNATLRLATVPVALVAFAFMVSLAPAPVNASASAGMSAVTASRLPLQAFVLADAPDSLADLQAHVQDVGVVYPTYFECARFSGRVLGADTGAITAFARAHEIAVMPRFNCQDGSTVHAILTDPRVRARTLATLTHIAETPAYAGVNLDLENDVAGDRTALSSFVSVLARLLHEHDRRVAVDVDGVTHEDATIATGFYDDRALAAAADYVFVMAWGAHWEGSAAGPLAPLSFVAGVVRFLASLPHAGRFVLGAPMYGLDWPAPVASAHPVRVSSPPRANALQYANVLALAHTTGATPRRDRSVDEMTFAYTHAGVTHRVWYMDARAIADRLQAAREHGLAVGIWRLGAEDQALWSSSAVLERLTGAASSLSRTGPGE